MTDINDDEEVYTTEYLPLAAYLLATEALEFLGKEGTRSKGERVKFFFYDPEGEGPDLAKEYFADGECGAASFYDAIRRARKIMDMD